MSQESLILTASSVPLECSKYICLGRRLKSTQESQVDAGCWRPCLDLQALHPVEDSVVLLSGGLDSLTGAIDLVEQGRVRKTNRLERLLEILLQFVLKSITINRFYCQGEV